MTENPQNDATASADVTGTDTNRRRFLKLAGVGSVAALAGCTQGGGGGGGGGNGNWEPSEPVRYIVPYDQGGGTDTYARGIVEAFTDSLGQNVQIENIPGAGGLNGFGQLMSAEPDGHTILGSATPLEVAPQMLEDPGFDQRDATGIGVFGSSAWTLVVNKQYEGEVEDLTDVIEKYNSGEWKSIGIQEPGSSQDIIVLLAKYKLDYNWNWKNRVHYTGTGPVSEAVAKNEVPCGIGTDAGTQSVVDNGSIFPATVFVSDGSPVYKDVPSVTDLDFPEMDFVGGLQRGMYAPPETPRDIRDVLSQRLKEAVEADSTQQWSKETGNPVGHEGPDQAEKIITDAFKKYEELNVIQLVEQHAN
ncbi:Bug family tripartite tricarboxylate transporter substrate binding protein [Halegenticoccus tardaugens]|uniref:Bug family tripartite tricarboxylate transporter substrate binding protein n=1 Tax=Halegenticoccus tardaugens TaxID=2071624 RepID=UPI00100BE173|nr:tripartite tricarboxylate transporter substrate binding protein [Halegenticoccus tardaugens]